MSRELSVQRSYIEYKCKHNLIADLKIYPNLQKNETYRVVFEKLNGKKYYYSKLFWAHFISVKSNVWHHLRHYQFVCLYFML
jgi:hypothetical protein